MILDDKTFYGNVEDYDFSKLHGEPISIGFHFYNQTDDEYIKFRSFDKPFEGYIRNITIDGVVQSMDQNRLNGTLISKSCPTEITFTSYEGAAKLNENVTIDSDNLDISFEFKIVNCSECCNTSAVLLSAFGFDSYFLLEIVQNRLYWKFKSGSFTSYHSLFSFVENQFCDGNWHKSLLNLLFNNY